MEYEVVFFLIPHLSTAVSSHTVMRAAPIHICHKKSLNPSFVASPLLVTGVMPSLPAHPPHCTHNRAQAMDILSGWNSIPLPLINSL